MNLSMAATLPEQIEELRCALNEYAWSVERFLRLLEDLDPFLLVIDSPELTRAAKDVRDRTTVILLPEIPQQ